MIGRVERPVGGWELLFPPGWAALPTDPQRAPEAIRRMLDRAFAGRHRDELAPLRIDIDRQLRAMTARAWEQGARSLHALTEPVAGRPVAASLLITPLQIAEGVDEDVVSLLGDADGVLEHGRVEVGGRPALRRHRRAPARVEVAGAGHDAWQTTVDYVIDLDDAHLLVLTFTTTTDEVSGPLRALFDAIASTLRQRTPDASSDGSPRR